MSVAVEDATALPRLTAPLPVARDDRARRWRWVMPGLIVVIVVAATAQVLASFTNPLSPLDVLAVLGGADTPRLHEIAVNARVPRMAVGIIAGMALAAAGALLQAITRNPLADPALTGVAPGAVAAAVLWVGFGPSLVGGLGTWLVPLVATLGGLATAVLVYVLTRRAGSVESTRLIFIGLLVGGILNSLTTVGLLFLSTQELQGLFGWLVGSLSLVTWTDLWLTTVYAIPGFLVLIPAIARANCLQLGNDVAVSLGQRSEFDRFVVVVAAVMLTSGVVVIAGGIAFVGLMAPHMVRGTVGSDLRRLVPASMLAGAAMVLVADVVARLFDPRWLPWGATSGTHLPVGVFLTLFGAVFLLRLLRMRSAA